MTTQLITPYLTIEDVCEVLHTHHSTIRRYVTSGDLPASRMGKRLLFTQEDLAAFMRRRQVRPRVLAS